MLSKNIFGKYDAQIKLLLAVLVGGLLIFAAYQLYKWIKGATPPPGAEEVQQVNPNNLTYQIGDYSILADSLEAAMVTSGTDEDAVLETLNQLQTADDLRQLIVTFGKRTNYILSIPQYTENLVYWLQEELSGSDKDKAQAIFNKFSIPF